MTKKQKITSTFRANSFCCVLNNVDELFDKESIFFNNERFSDKTRKRILEFRNKLANDKNEYTPKDMVNHLVALWIGESESNSCAVNYEIGDNGIHHCHMILESKQAFRFSKLLKLFPTIHVEITRGSREQVMAYLIKSGEHEEKAHTVVVPMVVEGEIKASEQGKRTDLEKIQQLLEEGLKPEQILSQNLSWRRYSSMIKEHYYQLRRQQTPMHKNNLIVIWHTGDSRSGKSYTQIKLMEENSVENVYVWSDYQNGGLDGYQGEDILFMEEFKGELSYAEFLKVTDNYPQQMHARYSNIYALWTEIHISSIFTPKQVYNILVPEEKRNDDTIQQMMKRINQVVYHFKIVIEGEILYKTLTFTIDDFNRLSKEQVEKFAYLFDEWNPKVMHYNFEKDAFHPSMNPVNNKKRPVSETYQSSTNKSKG